MRILLVLAVTISGLLAFGVACGGDEEKAEVIPSPASESEGEAGEAEEWEGEGVAEEEEEEIEEAEETPADADEPGEAEVDEGEAEEEEEGPAGACRDSDMDDVCDEDDDLCLDTAAGSEVDDVGCSDVQVDQDNDGICDPAAVSDGPGDCDLLDDNCPLAPNPDQDDFDGDLEGDACDDDDDNDGFPDADEVRADSDRLDFASVPENDAVNPGSCSDFVDNDLDGDIDDDDLLCRVEIVD
jgi:hypothetical protein